MVLAVAGESRVGPYRILRLVNRGGQGSVYLGYDKRLHRRVAIKIYALPGERSARQRLLREAQLVASIQSPKVVQIHDVIESREHLAMVMEYVPGCDLEDFLGAVRPSLASLLTIAADIAGALTAARQQHIVHGDLKARNVLIAPSGRAKLTDFGIARSAAAGGISAGSLSSVSPEQYLGEPLDERSDLFALGCLLYRMVTGVHPFHANGQLDARALLEMAPAPLEELLGAEVELPRELGELVSNLLQKDPSHRPANTRVVRQTLRRAARNIPLAASNSLLAEARPCFRPESAEDIPPAVPPDLGRAVRSRMARGDQRSAWFARLKSPQWRWPVIATVALMTAGLAFALSLPPVATHVHIEAPAVRLAAGAQLPAEISSRWLVAAVTAAMQQRLGPVRVSGPIGATRETRLSAGSAAEGRELVASEQVRLELRCVDLLCVFAVSRHWQGRQQHQQSVLFADMPVQQWRDVVHATTLALFRD